MADKPYLSGWHNGIFWCRHRLNRIFPHLDYQGNWKGKSWHYFAYEEGNPEGSHFATMEELFNWIDEAVTSGWIKQEDNHAKKDV